MEVNIQKEWGTIERSTANLANSSLLRVLKCHVLIFLWRSKIFSSKAYTKENYLHINQGALGQILYIKQLALLLFNFSLNYWVTNFQLQNLDPACILPLESIMRIFLGLFKVNYKQLACWIRKFKEKFYLNPWVFEGRMDDYKWMDGQV